MSGMNLFGEPMDGKRKGGHDPNKDWEFNKHLWFLTEQGLNAYFSTYPGLEGHVATQPDLKKSMNNIVAEVVGIGGKTLVRNKVNGSDCGTFALETWSTKPKPINNFRGKVGWSGNLDINDDFVSFLYADTKFFCVLPFPLLRATFIQCAPEFEKQFKPNLQANGSEFIHVPRELFVVTMIKVSQARGLPAEHEEWFKRALQGIRENQTRNIQTIARNYQAAVGRMSRRGMLPIL